MEFLLFATVLIGIFFFMIYMPTTILVKKFDKKDEYESLLIFLAASLLFALLTYLFANFYVLKSTELLHVVKCDFLANMNCVFNGELSREIVPAFDIYMMVFMEILLGFTYAYYVTVNINDYKSKSRRTLTMILFFTVAVVSSLISITVMNDLVFTAGLKYISLFISNVYVVLPLFYLFILKYRYSCQAKKK